MILERIPCLAPTVDIFKVKTIRIKVTDNCPFDCSFCHKEGNPLSENIDLDENFFYSMSKLRNDLKLNEVHLTGGEPTCYPHIVRIIDNLHNMGFIVKMTSNGQFDSKLLENLKKAGLCSINFSIHTLRPLNLVKIQKTSKSLKWSAEALARQVNNLEVSKKIGLSPKINTVVQKEPEDALEIIDFCKSETYELRLLDDLSPNSLSIQKIIQILKNKGSEVEGVDITEGVSGFSYRIKMNDDFRFKVKSIRKCILRSICNKCMLRDQCVEWFYGMRIEQFKNKKIVRLCIHRQDYPAIQELSHFPNSLQYQEIKQFVESFDR